MPSDVSEILNQEWVKKYLAQPLIARMATCDPRNLQPHVVPVWYEWDGEALWISSFRSTRKIREIMRNPLISVVVDTDQPGKAANGVVFEGKAEMISERVVVEPRATSIYTRYLGTDGVLAAEPQSWIHDAENLIIRLKPERVSAW